MRRLIIFFTKIPEKGFGKSRLKGFLNDDQIFELNKHLVRKNLEAALKTNVATQIFYFGEPSRLEEIIVFVPDIAEQRGDGLGERMYQAFSRGFMEYDRIILIGSDLVDLESSIIEKCFSVLDSKDMVICPTEDGGYGLIGMKKLYDVFSGIEYSNQDVYRKTLEKAESLGIDVSSPYTLSDVDIPIDLVKAELGRQDVSLLGAGEYNLNYRIGEDLVFRINMGSQLGLGKDQIKYEFNALKTLEGTEVTPKAVSYGSGSVFIPFGNLTMEYLEGRPLDYDKDLETAAILLARVHEHDVEGNSLLKADRPFRTMYEEFISMYSKYKSWEKRDPFVESRIDHFLETAESMGLNDVISDPCIINTELNNRNFIIGEKSYIIDWEKPIIGEREQDLAHFMVPTTTNWKTEKILSKDEMDEFLRHYEKQSHYDRNKLRKYMVFNTLRGVTWCAMAKVEYSNGRVLSDPITLEKIDKFLSPAFLNLLYDNFYKEYHVQKA